jgi:hypothetical protein
MPTCSSQADADTVRDRSKIVAAIDGLQPGGGTNGASGIDLAYREAQSGFIDAGITTSSCARTETSTWASPPLTRSSH